MLHPNWSVICHIADPATKHRCALAKSQRARQRLAKVLPDAFSEEPHDEDPRPLSTIQLLFDQWNGEDLEAMLWDNLGIRVVKALGTNMEPSAVGNTLIITADTEREVLRITNEVGLFPYQIASLEIGGTIGAGTYYPISYVTQEDDDDRTIEGTMLAYFVSTSLVDLAS